MIAAPTETPSERVEAEASQVRGDYYLTGTISEELGVQLAKELTQALADKATLVEALKDILLRSIGDVSFPSATGHSIAREALRKVGAA